MQSLTHLAGPIHDDLVEEALCFGWIDSQVRRVDDDRVMQWFSPRRGGGVWSALNKERIERLVGEGQMTDRGEAAIDTAKADGSWSQIDHIDALVMPPDLEEALAAAPEAQHADEALSESATKQYVWWILSAKRPATRSGRNRRDHSTARIRARRSLDAVEVSLMMSVHFLPIPDEVAAVGDDYVLVEVDGTRGADSTSGHHARLWRRDGVLLATTDQLALFR